MSLVFKVGFHHLAKHTMREYSNSEILVFDLMLCFLENENTDFLSYVNTVSCEFSILTWLICSNRNLLKDHSHKLKFSIEIMVNWYKTDT